MESLAEIINNHSTRLFLLPNNHYMHSEQQKRRSFLSLCCLLPVMCGVAHFKRGRR